MIIHQTENGHLATPFRAPSTLTLLGGIFATALVVCVPLPAYACGNAMEPLDTVVIHIIALLVGAVLALPALVWAAYVRSSANVTWRTSTLIALSASVCATLLFHVGLYVMGEHIGVYRPEFLVSLASLLQRLPENLQSVIAAVFYLGVPVAISFAVATHRLRR